MRSVRDGTGRRRPGGASPQSGDRAMETPLDPLSPLILTISYLGDVVFAISGALTAMRYRMDIR
jgi:hypothetical protein